jgi:iron complex transport system substrate-binding protein
MSRATLWAGVLAAVMASARAAPVSVVDDGGHAVTLPAPAQRVVSLAPNLTELVFAAGGGSALRGVIRFSDHPAAARELPVVGDAFAIDYEGLVKLKPDLVLVWSSGLNDRQQARLRALGLNVFDSEIRHAQGISDTLRRLGVLLGHTETAEAAASRFEQQWHALIERHAGKRPVRVFWQLWHDPLMTVNREHLIGEAITACGGVNVFGTMPLLTPTVSWEAAVTADPELVAASGREEDATRDFSPWRRFMKVRAVQRSQFAHIDGDLIGRMGPRFVDGATALCAAIDSARTAQSVNQAPPTLRQRQP